MSKVKANLIKVNLKAGNFKLACHLALLNNGNGSFSGDYESVYLPNAYDDVKEYITKHQWAGYLSALSQDGKYRAYDDEGYFGGVKG